MNNYLSGDIITGGTVIAILIILIRLWIKKKRGLSIEYDPYQAQMWPLNGIPRFLPALDKNNPADQVEARKRTALVWTMAIGWLIIGVPLLLLLIYVFLNTFFNINL